MNLNLVNSAKLFGIAVAVAGLSLIVPAGLDRVANSVGIETAFVSQALAQAQDKKTRRLPGLGQNVMKVLGEVTALISPDTEKDPTAKPNIPEALKELQKAEKACKDKCNKYEIASLYRFFAFAYYSMDDVPKTISAYKTIIAQSPEIPVAVELEALNYLSQLLYGQEDYQGSLKYLNDWLTLSESTPPDKIFFRGQIYYAMNKKVEALKDVASAIDMVEKSGKVAKEQWYSMELAIVLEKEDYKAGKPILETLIRHYPKVKWWTQYSNIYGLLDRPAEQLATLDAIDVMDGFEKRQEYINAAYLYLGEDVPYKAAKILERGIKKGSVEPNVKNLKTLALAYRQAKELDSAVATFEKAAQAAKKEDAEKKDDKKYTPEEGNIYADLAAVLGMMDKSKEAVEAGKKALAAGNLKRACEVHTNMGIAYVDLRQYQSAINSFEKASQDKQCRVLVQNWLRYAENEKKQADELARSM